MISTFIKRLAVDVPLLETNHLAFMLTHRPDDIQMAEHPRIAQMKADLKLKMEISKGIATIPIQGALAYNPDICEMFFDGVEDSRAVTQMLNEAADNDDVKGVLIRMDTPGGMLLGGPEMADAVSRIKASKPVVTHIGGLGASLGYMIASQSSAIVANRSAIVGSIGVIASVTDYTGMLDKYGVKFEYFTNKEAKFKGVGAMGKPLTDDQRGNIQEGVDSAFQLFKGMVSACRPNVPDSAMQGQTFRGSDAQKLGLVDMCGDEQCALGVLMSRMKK